jgi:hypothetical protein
VKLAISHLACQESALHGLGHWKRAHPERVQAIIDAFLAKERGLPDVLRHYAKQARAGHVL